MQRYHRTTAIFATAVVLTQTDAPRRFISAAVAALAVVILGGGVVGAIVGERELEHPAEENHSEDGGSGEEGMLIHE